MWSKVEVEAAATDRCADAAPSRWGPRRVVNVDYQVDALPQQTRRPKYSTITPPVSPRPLYLAPLNTLVREEKEIHTQVDAGNMMRVRGSCS